MKIVYDKLVRDNIPRILEQEKVTHSYRVANKDEYPAYLKKKLQEEVDEFLESPCIEELADIAEVLEHLALVVGGNPGQVGVAMRYKSYKRGKFLKGYILESVSDEEQD
jgi:predicted house-cleaning noncanonical NTP pyrophosphatase (MazG superfamily)